MDAGSPRVPVKKCSKCGEVKSLSAFGRDKSKKDGLNSWCKECCNVRNRAWNKANPGALASAQKRYYEKNGRPKATTEQNFWKRVKAHGLTRERYEEMILNQNDTCPICNKQLGQSPSIDHDHSCCPGKFSCGNCVRGLLHRGCNAMLGIVEEDVHTLERAIRYLRRK
jgi:hypothetical protein